jgi:Ti-type conjugative transfer relaxase TraA
VALYHFSAKVISRASGRSAVAAAAYRSGSELQDERAGQAHDFRAKTGVVHSEILLPQGAPERLSDRATLWNEVEATEKRKDAQLAREVEFALPREMSRADGIALARAFVQREFVDRGMVADLNLHWDQAPDGSPKPHAHAMLSMREVGPEGFGKKVRDWNATTELQGWRERWGEHVNARLAELGIDARIDHRSLKDQGFDLEPQHKIGPAGVRREARGEGAERADEHRAIAQRNGTRIAAEPEIALAALTHQHATFTRQGLARLIHRHSDGAEQFAALMAKVEAAPEMVRLGADDRGAERFTTRTMIATEARMERAAEALGAGRGHGVDASVQAEALASRGLGDEQEAAFRHVTGEGDLALVVGYAGTGKSTMLGAAREAWAASGYSVRGATLSGIAAENLEAGSGIGSRTIASLEHGWSKGRDGLTSRDVLVIDEAGMVGSRQMERVLSHAAEAEAKVVMVGDPEQLQAIEAGAAFRALAERHGAAEITTVRRQAAKWQREATKALATGRTAEALSRYEAAGMVQVHDTRDAAKTALVTGWDAERRAEPGASTVILAYTRADVADLNRLARERMREAGALGTDQTVMTERGERSFAPGDRVMFLRNERGLGVKNGTLGTVEQVTTSGMAVRVDGDERRIVAFDLKDYADLDHGYAATVHKAQGVTVDRAHVLASTHLDRHAAYVGLTRHRTSVALHYGRDDFRDGDQLARGLGRERAKDTTLDYATGFAERRGIAPVSSIVVDRPAASEQDQEGASPRRGMFAGLKLGRGRVRGSDQPLDQNVDRAAPVPIPVSNSLEAASEAYVRAFAETERMRATRLPVLPHQALALVRAGEGLDAADRGLGRDLRAALERTPGLAGSAGTWEGRAALQDAVEQERAARLDPTIRAERYVARWKGLETAYAAAGRTERDGVSDAMRILTAAIKRDALAEGVMKARAKELGIASGSRLARVIDATSEREAERATPAQDRGLSR